MAFGVSLAVPQWKKWDDGCERRWGVGGWGDNIMAMEWKHFKTMHLCTGGSNLGRMLETGSNRLWTRLVKDRTPTLSTHGCARKVSGAMETCLCEASNNARSREEGFFCFFIHLRTPFPFNKESLRHMCILNGTCSLVKDARFAKFKQHIGLAQVFPFVKAFLVRLGVNHFLEAREIWMRISKKILTDSLWRCWTGNNSQKMLQTHRENSLEKLKSWAWFNAYHNITEVMYSLMNVSVCLLGLVHLPSRDHF